MVQKALIDDEERINLEYAPISPTLKAFHDDNVWARCVIGEFGSGKTSAACNEICGTLPLEIYEWYGIRETRWAVVRNSYRELIDNVLEPLEFWFQHGHWHESKAEFTVIHRIEVDGKEVELKVVCLLRACDVIKDVKKFKSMNITGAWIDESSEVADQIRTTLQGRVGRYPHRYKDPRTGETKPCPLRFFIETTNPPDVEQAIYSDYEWNRPPPGPLPSGKPKKGFRGYWQHPGENKKNLNPNYYDGLQEAFRDQPDMLARYLKGEPGVMIEGKKVYDNFKFDYHVAEEPLIWCKDVIFRGWDNTGNCPAAVAVQLPTAGQAQVLKEWHTERKGIVDFTQGVVTDCNKQWPNAEFIDWADPAGFNTFSKKGGGFTSNAALMDTEEAGNVEVESSEQNFTARKESVEQLLGRIDGLLIDPMCVRLINGFIGGYHHKEIGKPGSGTFSKDPVKNKYSHVHDALQYVIVRLFRARKPRDEEEDRRFASNQNRRQPDEDTGY